MRFSFWGFSEILFHVSDDLFSLFVMFVLNLWGELCGFLVFLEVGVAVEGKCVESSLVSWFFQTGQVLFC